MTDKPRHPIFLSAPQGLKTLQALAVALAALWGFAPLPVMAGSTLGTGRILKQIPARMAPAPAATPGLTITPPKTGAVPTAAAFMVKHIRITGSTLFPAGRLHALVASGEGRQMTLARANDLAKRITRFYQQHGYPLDLAYIPAQAMKNATLTIAVVEARYNKVILENHSRVRTALLKATLAPIHRSLPVARRPLNRSLLLLNDIPGVAASSTLNPGALPGTSDLTVKAAPRPRFTGSVGIDDYGDSYTGRARFSGDLTINNPFHWGDALNLSGMTSGSKLNYGRIGYRSVVSGRGTVLGASGALLHYRLGEYFENLGARGNAAIGDLFLRQPVVRGVATNFDIQLAYGYKRLRDDINSSNIQNDDRHINALHVTLSGNHRDRLGLSDGSLTFTGGRVGFDNNRAQQADAQGADTQNDYGKLNISLARLQRLTENNSLYVTASGQLSTCNLDSSEQFYLGGPGSIRGYTPAVIGGDEGIEISAELRHNFHFRLPGLWQVAAFVNHGYVRINKNNDFTGHTGDNHARLSSAGVGLNWQGPHGLTASTSLAVPFGSKPSLISDQSRATRLWLRIRKWF